MPSGEVHENFECACLPLVLGAGIWMRQKGYHLSDHLLVLFAASYLFSVFYFSPDLDLKQCRARKNWGPLGFLWIPYSFFFSHRGVSHSWLLGTWTRILYLSIVAISLLAATGKISSIDPKTLHHAMSWIHAYRMEIGTLFAGLSFPNFLHILLDSL